MVRENRYEILLMGLLVFLVTIPVADHALGDGADLVLRFALGALLLFGVVSLHGTRRWFATGSCVAATAIALQLAMLVWPSTGLTAFAQAVSLGFAVIVIMVALDDVLFRGPVDRHKIVGAVSVYLLVGVAWMLLYSMVETLVPGSFEGLEAVPGRELTRELLYYSFVTLSTLGYGDISPVSPVAEALAWTEAVFGQLYLTILVASLVGMHLASRREPGAASDR